MYLGVLVTVRCKDLLWFRNKLFVDFLGLEIIYTGINFSGQVDIKGRKVFAGPSF